jgi:seryl-tRNA synthetase
MHDIKWIRQNPEQFDKAMQDRGLEPQSQALLAIDEGRRIKLTRLQELQAERNELAREIGARMKAKQEAQEVITRANEVKETINALQKDLEEVDELAEALSHLPNMLDKDVPLGKDENDNKQIREWGEPKQLSGAKQHFELGEALGQMDFETAVKMSGSRFVMLRNQLARLERALANFALDLHTQEFGYEEVAPPLMVRDNALYGTGQLPKFVETEGAFKTTNGFWLIPTSEVPLTNIVADKILQASELPQRFTAYTPCFRAEAGAAGRDTRGMIRLHQFSKVELVSITLPENSEQELERKLACAEDALKRLELPYRTMLLCTGDSGFSVRKTYDIEVWLPGQGQYREISSCSNCGDFQARRMKARFRREGEKQTEFMHTLNGTGLAIGRAMVAILENYQQEDGSIAIPTALQPYMQHQQKIEIAA